MYQLITAYTRKDRRKDQWVETDVSVIPIRDLKQHYPEVWLMITYPALGDEHQALYFDDVVNLTKDALQSLTVAGWLTSLGNMSLPLRTEFPSFKPKYVKYINAWYGRFSVEPIDESYIVDNTVSKFDKKHLKITHPDVDGPTLRKRAMISINGFFHFTEYTPDGIIVHHGNQSIRHANDNHVGVHSFMEVGEINYLNITDDMISNINEGAPLSDGVYVTLPKSVNLKDKTILMVIGGYLQALGKGYTRTGEHTFRIQLSNLMLLERFYQSRHFMDMHDAPRTIYGNDIDLLSVGELHSDEMIRWLINRTQTFFVVVDVPSMFHAIEPVEHMQLPGRYMDNTPNNYPLIGAYGRVLEYRHLFYPGERYVLASTPNRRYNFDFNRRPWRDSLAVNHGSNSEHPFTHTDAFWRLLGTQD